MNVSAESLTVFGGRRGRKPRAEQASVPKTFRFSPSEIERLEQAAKVNKQNTSDFARDAIVTAADDCLESHDS